MIKQLTQYVIALAIIFICLYVGIAIQSFFHMSLPGSIIGMLLLFALMASGILPAKWVQPGASLFIRHMMFLFVPISVGLMVHFDMLGKNAIPIFASTIGGTLIVLVSMSLILDRLLSREKK